MKPIHSLLTLSFTVILGAVSLQAGEIFGTVTDTSGRAAGSVKVTIVSAKDLQKRETSTNVLGCYVLPRLDAGEYTVAVKHPGFALQERKGIVVRAQEIAHVDFTLGVTELTETIDVSDMVTVPCTVTDKNGLYITHLGKEDFL